VTVLIDPATRTGILSPSSTSRTNNIMSAIVDSIPSAAAASTGVVIEPEAKTAIATVAAEADDPALAAGDEVSTYKRRELAGELLPEPLLVENPKRFVIFPIEHNDVRPTVTPTSNCPSLDF